jgi:hypothetical protein
VFYRRPLQLGRGLRTAVELVAVLSAALFLSFLILQMR